MTYEDDSSDRALYEKDLQEMERAAVEALTASKVRPLTDDEVMLVAWCAGVSNQVFKEIRHEPQ